jgi:anthranilate phosphoribosyltransferase
MAVEHPFAEYIRILGKGKSGSRSLTIEEAHRAMKMILAGEVEPIQLGAFLMLLRVKEETGEEVAGFVRAVQESLQLPADLPEVRLDWSSYAGKRRQLPWYVLSALLLASGGYSVFMHGIAAREDDRIYTPQVLQALGVKAAQSLAEAAEQIRASGFAFMTLAQLSPRLHEIIELRPVLGLRSPVHTLARMLNPFQAPATLMGIFHPGYRDIHQEAALLLKQPRMAVFKGEGGEVERNPDIACKVQTVINGEQREDEWPAMFTGPRHLKDETMDVTRLAKLWRGETEDEYGQAAVIGTAAIALNIMGEADTIEAAEAMANTLWAKRPASWPRAA